MLGPLSYALHTSPRRHRRPSSLCSFLAEEGEERSAQRLPINFSSSSPAEEGRAARYGKMSSERRDSNPQPSARQADARPLRHTRTNTSWERDSNPRGLHIDGFAGRRLQPLGHPSTTSFQRRAEDSNLTRKTSRAHSLAPRSAHPTRFTLQNSRKREDSNPRRLTPLVLFSRQPAAPATSLFPACAL